MASVLTPFTGVSKQDRHLHNDIKRTKVLVRAHGWLVDKRNNSAK